VNQDRRLDPEIIVRRLSPEDWRIERGLRLAALADAPSAFGSRLADAELFNEAEWRARLSGQTRFAASVDGRFVGTAGYAAGREPYPVASAVLVGMWVMPGPRGRGVADQLVAAATVACRLEGFASIWLSVTHGNEVAARLYERHSFARTGTDLEGDGDTFDMALALI